MFKKVVVSALFASVASLTLAQDIQPSPERLKFSVYIADIAKTLTHNKPLLVNGDWKKNEEVVAYRKFTPLKRAAGVFALYKLQDDYDKIAFPQLASNPDQLKISMFTRRNTFIHYVDLFGDTIHDSVAKEFLYGEIADLTEVVTGKLTAQAYRNNSDARYERVIILLNSAAFFTEVARLEEENKGSGKTVAFLAKKAYIEGLTQSCGTDMKFCLKAAGR